MKPLSPHDPRDQQLDDLIAAALHGELTPEERAQFDSRLSNDPAAQAAYQEALAMHDLLEKTHQSAQPDSAFEQRMVSGVRRKLQTKQHPETALESLLALWNGVKSVVIRKRQPLPWLGSAIAILCILFVLAGVALGPITNGIKQAKGNAEMQEARQRMLAANEEQADQSQAKSVFSTVTSKLADNNDMALTAGSTSIPADKANLNGGATDSLQLAMHHSTLKRALQFAGKDQPTSSAFAAPMAPAPVEKAVALDVPSNTAAFPGNLASRDRLITEDEMKVSEVTARSKMTAADKASGTAGGAASASPDAIAAPAAPATIVSAAAPTPADNRKLVRNAELNLEVKSYQDTIGKIAPMTKAAGGYVDTSRSEKGGNGKLQGRVVVKVLPQNLDDFLLKLRDLGQVNNQSVSTDDVTKDYYDTQARLENSRRMETQLQELLKHENGKVSDLLAVERELGRVRGEIEQMQGQLKLYDFQVQYATVTMEIAEKDLKQAAAYLLKEQDVFSLYATDVEGTFQKARQSAETYKAQILTAKLNHNSGSDVSAELVIMVAPDEIESFLGDVRSLGRVANFTRETKRFAKDGGQSDQPADETLTEKEKVQVHLAIRSDDESRKQVALTVVAKAVDTALDQAKAAALANAGVEILSSSLNKTPHGESTAQLSVRVPGKDYAALIDSFNALGRPASLSIQRNDNSGPGANGDDAPVIVSLSLTDNDTPLQETEMAVLASDVDTQAQQIKKDAATAGVEVKSSSFERQPDGTELAQIIFRLPMAKYPAFLDSVKKLGKVESLSVRRDDRPDQTRADDTAPAEISLQLHNQRDIVADNDGLWATLRKTFGDGADALFGSIRVIGVAIAFIVPWVFTIILVAWIARRIYIWRKNR